MQSAIDYGKLMQRAMQGLIAEILQGVADHGLPGEHHFFITFDTRAEGVEIAAWLRERYPEEMTIVIQNWFDNLRIHPEGFEITLNFGDSPEPLKIPFSALRAFIDPSVEFGLRFETQDDAEDDAPHEEVADAPLAQDVPTEPAKSAEVVSLDKFRK